jgi:hypothetical protein
MPTSAAPATGAPRPGREGDGDRLGRRDLLVLKLELQLERRRRVGPATGSAQRSTRSTR